MRNVLLFCCLLLGAGCQNQEREAQLQKQAADLAHREQALLLRENELTLREQRLSKATQVLDSTQQVPADSVQARFMGTWATRMECVETDCPGSAIGDSKNEQWEVSYVQQRVLVKASANNKIVRVYSGAFSGNTLELTAQHPANDTLPDATITVQLQAAGRRLEGRRDISRPDNCHIVYALALTKDAPPLVR